MLSYAVLLVMAPLVMRPAEKSASAVSVMPPSATRMWERGFGSSLDDVMADSPAKKKAAEDTAPCGRV